MTFGIKKHPKRVFFYTEGLNQTNHPAAASVSLLIYKLHGLDLSGLICKYAFHILIGYENVCFLSRVHGLLYAWLGRPDFHRSSL